MPCYDRGFDLSMKMLYEVKHLEPVQVQVLFPENSLKLTLDNKFKLFYKHFSCFVYNNNGTRL